MKMSMVDLEDPNSHHWSSISTEDEFVGSFGKVIKKVRVSWSILPCVHVLHDPLYLIFKVCCMLTCSGQLYLMRAVLSKLSSVCHEKNY